MLLGVFFVLLIIWILLVVYDTTRGTIPSISKKAKISQLIKDFGLTSAQVTRVLACYDGTFPDKLFKHLYSAVDKNIQTAEQWMEYTESIVAGIEKTHCHCRHQS
jgi:hypothetical protein